MLRIALSITLICGCLWILPATAEPVFGPGSRVGLLLPPDFFPSDQFAGYISPQEGGSILIIELPAEAYDEVSGLSDAAWASKEIVVQSRVAMSIDGARAVLIKGRQFNSGVTFQKWVVIIGFDGFTALVTAQIPANVPEDRLAAIDQSLKSIQSRAALTVGEKVAALPFTIGSTDNMRVWNVFAGNTIGLTRGSKNIVDGAEQPILFITRSSSSGSAAGLSAENSSRLTIKKIATLSDIEIEDTDTVRFAGSDGFEIVARARVAETNEPVAIVQWVSMLDDGYMRIVGITRIETRAADFTAFRAIRDSVQAK